MLEEKNETSEKQKELVYIFISGHHYAKGPLVGDYPDPQHLRDFVEILKRYEVKGTFLLDGIFVEEIEKRDPSFFGYLNELGMPIGYHGDETHGPLSFREITENKRWNEVVKATVDRLSYRIDYKIDEKTLRLDRSFNPPLRSQEGWGAKGGSREIWQGHIHSWASSRRDGAH
jgi:hypothetical protein